MEDLKSQVAEFTQIKESIKKLTERKKELEQIICVTMEENEVSTIELPNGSNLNHKVKDSLSISKEKAERKPRKIKPN